MPGQRLPRHNGRPRHSGRTRRAAAVAAVAVVAVAALVAGACSSDSDPATGAGEDAPPGSDPTTSTTSTVPGYTPVLDPAPCTDVSTPTDSIDCRVLVLPEDRTRPTERQVELPVLLVGGALSGGETAAAPVVYLHGGPGGGAVEGWVQWRSLADGLGRELVVYDQRGGGDATPRLTCPEHDAALLEVLSTDAPWAEERASVAGALTVCHERLDASGTDLDQYDTPTSVRDLEDLRLALGAPTMTLVGVSYGSRLALDYLRTHPDHVESLVLDGVDAPGTADPELERALPGAAIARLVEACGRDAACAASHPGLSERIEQVVAGADATPLRVTLPASPDGTRAAVELTLTGADLTAGLFAAMYDSEVVPLLPSLIEQLAAGDTGVVELVLRASTESLLGGAVGATMSVNCADRSLVGDRGDRDRTAALVDPGAASTVVLSGTDSFCSEWQVEPVGGSFVDPLRVDDPPPTLVVAGELDPITPAADARSLAEQLDATFVEIPRAGHAPLLTDACARTVLRTFLVDATAPDLSCTTSIVPRPFA